MTQTLWLGVFGGAGIVGVLFIMGGALYVTGIMKELGSIAIGAAIVIAVVLGLLGIVGVLKRIVG